jgi:hypothetical protein
MLKTGTHEYMGTGNYFYISALPGSASYILYISALPGPVSKTFKVFIYLVYFDPTRVGFENFLQKFSKLTNQEHKRR